MSPDAQLNFLRRSASSLATQSPSTAAHLSAERTNILLAKERTLSESDRREACTACGSPMIPGWTSHLCSEPEKQKWIARRKGSAKKRKPVKSDVPVTRKIISECLVCHRKTYQAFQVAQTARLPQERGPAASSQTAPTEKKTERGPSKLRTIKLQSQDSAAGNGTSKERAKTRKKATLHAFLAEGKKRKVETSDGPTDLNLIDFLKS